MSFPLDHCHMQKPGIIYHIYFCVVHGGASPSCGVFKDYSNMAVEIILRKEHEIKRIYYTYSTYSSTLAWQISWTEEPGGLPSMESLQSDTTERLHFHFSLSWIGEGNCNPLQCFCLKNPKDWGAWWAVVPGVTQSRTWLKQLSSSSSSITLTKGFPDGSVVNNPPANAGHASSTPELGRSSGEGNGKSLQYSCLENPMVRGALQATIHRVAKRRTWLSHRAWERLYSLVPGEGYRAHHARTTWEKCQGSGSNLASWGAKKESENSWVRASLEYQDGVHKQTAWGDFTGVSHCHQIPTRGGQRRGTREKSDYSCAPGHLRIAHSLSVGMLRCQEMGLACRWQ